MKMKARPASAPLLPSIGAAMKDSLMNDYRFGKSSGVPPTADNWKDWCRDVPILSRVDPAIGLPLVRHWYEGKDLSAFYRVSKIRKRLGGLRTIHAPRKALKVLQRAILDHLLYEAVPHSSCHGFRKGRSIFTNAVAHQRKDLVVTIDLKNCFSSIRSGRVQGIFKMLGATELAVSFMTDMCVLNGRLPTGAPTSPALANLVCRRLDARLNGLASANGAQYSRLGDDIALSGPRTIVTLRSLVTRIVREEGFTLAVHKTRIQPKGYRQKVAGIIVNDRPSVPRTFYRNVRAAVHRVSIKRKPEWDGSEIFLKSLKGRIAFVAATRPQAAGRLRTILQRVHG